MSTRITLPDDIERPLQRQAQRQHRTVEDVALELLAEAVASMESFPTPEEVVARIRATPPNPVGLPRVPAVYRCDYSID